MSYEGVEKVPKYEKEYICNKMIILFKSDR